MLLADCITVIIGGALENPPLYPLEKVSFRFTPTTDTKQFEVPSNLDDALG
jgi:hypothetical protein